MFKGMGFNVNNAIAKTKIAGTASQHSCAKYVRTYIEAGGIDTSKRPVAAYMYANYLPTIGFKKIASVTGKTNQAKWTSSNAKPGDIAVMKHGQYGHICMWNGSKWVSDFVQNSMWVYGGDGTCDIFRYA